MCTQSQEEVHVHNPHAFTTDLQQSAMLCNKSAQLPDLIKSAWSVQQREAYLEQFSEQRPGTSGP